ncbi:ABC transporter substrate-binding protein, partial [Streptomyces exfoliatus]|uniref:ABC transporter substrate-binding protein n=1 Tax=Streptomyces exfoliatus TaxID=1905 RepID=UPI0005605E6F
MTALDVPIVPKHVWEKVSDFSTFNNDTEFPIVGNGPFVLTDYKVDSYVKLKANKDFWRGAPKFDELVFRYYKDQDAAVAGPEAGERTEHLAVGALEVRALVVLGGGGAAGDHGG